MFRLIRRLAPRALVVLGLVLAGPVAARADQAIVVGVDRYPGLRPEASLAGCVNDARLVGERLERSGFRVTLLTDAEATRDGILQALSRARASSRSDERFVFYFSGHGTGGASPYLLPHDSVEGSFDRDLPAADLHQQVAAVPARSRTVVLDSCFSRLFARSRGLGTAVRNRHYEKGAARSRGLGPQDGTALRPDTNRHLAPGAASAKPSASLPEVCYFVASRMEEPAREEEFGGRMHGVFSYYLASRLLSNQVLWSDLQMQVGSLVAERTGDTQHPTLTPEYAGTLAFGGPPSAGMAAAAAPAPSPSSSDAWQVFNRDRVDPEALELSMRPARTTMKVGDLLSLSARCGTDGYLVVVEHGVSGRVNLLYPRVPEVDRARVRAGEDIGLPGAGQAYTPDTPGTERVRALLFGSREEAHSFLQAFQAVAGADFEQFVGGMKARDLKLAWTAPPGARSLGGGICTADVLFEVLPR